MMKPFIAFVLGAVVTAIIFVTSNLLTPPTELKAAPLNSEDILAAIKNRTPELQNTNIEYVRSLAEFDLQNFHELRINSQRLIAINDGEYVILGDFWYLPERINLTQRYIDEQQLNRVNSHLPQIASFDSVKFPAANDSSSLGTLYVFTDPTCEYCQMLHEQQAELAAAGINIAYIPFPRFGLSQNLGHQQLVQIMCADNPTQALTDFKNGSAGSKYIVNTDDTHCSAQVEQGFALGEKVGVTGTPFIIKSTGGFYAGFPGAQTIISAMSENNEAQ